uniref:Protein LSM12-like protein n=1 Tax=Noccaea caerulescens TaxID=107243 RepID=A0A1J3J5N9_NOCCA
MNPTGVTVAEGDEAGEKFAVGKTYEVKLATGIVFKGIVLAYDSDPNIIIFQDGTFPEKGDSMTTRMVNANSITELRYKGKFDDPLATKKRFVDLDGLRLKEELAIRNFERIGVGVTKEAQKIFDALYKTLPVQWEKKDIVVMGEVRVCSPYDSDCVTGGTNAANNRVKKVLKLEREKLQLSSGTGGN